MQSVSARLIVRLLRMPYRQTLPTESILAKAEATGKRTWTQGAFRALPISSHLHNKDKPSVAYSDQPPFARATDVRGHPTCVAVQSVALGSACSTWFLRCQALCLDLLTWTCRRKRDPTTIKVLIWQDQRRRQMALFRRANHVNINRRRRNTSIIPHTKSPPRPMNIKSSGRMASCVDFSVRTHLQSSFKRSNSPLSSVGPTVRTARTGSPRCNMAHLLPVVFAE